MPQISLQYRFQQPFGVPARAAYAWCTDYGPDDAKLFFERTRRSMRGLGEHALIITDTTYPSGRPRKIRRLVRLFPSELSWTNTHLDGPFQYSQFWYRVVPDGSRRSHLEFRGLRLEQLGRALSPKETARRARALQVSDSSEWHESLAPALERDLGGAFRDRPPGAWSKGRWP